MYCKRCWLVFCLQVICDHRGFLPPSIDPDRLDGLTEEEEAELRAAMGVHQSATRRRFLGTEGGPGVSVLARACMPMWSLIFACEAPADLWLELAFVVECAFSRR